MPLTRCRGAHLARLARIAERFRHGTIVIYGLRNPAFPTAARRVPEESPQRGKKEYGSGAFTASEGAWHEVRPASAGARPPEEKGVSVGLYGVKL